MARPARRTQPAPHPAAKGAAGPQAKLRIGAVNDPLEREADRAADAAMRGEAVGVLGQAPAAAQRLCSGCADEVEENHPVQRKCAACEAGAAANDRGAAAAADAVAAGGTPLSLELRAYFEPRFGRDFSDVRVHTDGRAAAAANAIGARAYTLGSSLAFAPGEYAPARRGGRHLIAHELAHAGQQANGDRTIRRTVAATSVCPANSAGAGADPLAELRTADAEAVRMLQGGSAMLAQEAARFQNPSVQPSHVSQAFRRRFGPTGEARRGRFRNRFDGAILATRTAAESAELMTLSQSLAGLATYLAGGIDYRCPGAATITVGGCTDRCRDNFMAWSCVPPDGRKIAICDLFWPLSGPQRAGAIIHESVHMNLDYFPHHSGNLTQRGRNPECYTSMILDLYQHGAPATERDQFVPVDTQCPALTGLERFGVEGRALEFQFGLESGAATTGAGPFLNVTALLGLGIPLERQSRLMGQVALQGQLFTANPRERDAYMIGVRLGLEMRTNPARFGLSGGLFGSAGLLHRPDQPGAAGGGLPARTGAYGEAGLGLGVHYQTSGGLDLQLRAFGAVGAEIATDPRAMRSLRGGLSVGLTF